MNRPARALCTLYLAAALFLAYATVQQALYGEAWAVAALAACSLVPLIAFIRETGRDDAATTARSLFGPVNAARARRGRPSLPRRTPGAELTVAAAMAAACCEVWWATAGADHDPATCTRKDSTA
jgi:hypothetical protein